MQGNFRSVAKERRSKIQLYYDIVSAIVEDSQNNDSVSPTRIQFKCNTSYDKLTKYLEEMKERQIIAREKSIKVTDKRILRISGNEESMTLHYISCCKELRSSKTKDRDKNHPINPNYVISRREFQTRAS